MEKAFLDFDMEPNLLYSFIKEHSKEVFLYLNLSLNTQKILEIFEGRQEWEGLENVIVTIGSRHKRTRD